MSSASECVIVIGRPGYRPSVSRVGPSAVQSQSAEGFLWLLNRKPADSSGMRILGGYILPVRVQATIFLAVLISAVGGDRG